MTETKKPSPLPDEPKVGDYCEGEVWCERGRVVKGFLICFEGDRDMFAILARGAGHDRKGNRIAGVLKSSLRRLSPPQPTGEGPSVTEPIAPPTPRVAAVVPKLHDPDGRYPHTGFPSAQDLENHAVARDRDIAAIKQHLADLGRPLLKMGGRFGKRVPVTHPTTWPSVGDDEP